MSKGCEQTFSKEDTQMAREHKKREMQIKTPASCHFTPTGLTRTKKPDQECW